MKPPILWVVEARTSSRDNWETVNDCCGIGPDHQAAAAPLYACFGRAEARRIAKSKNDIPNNFKHRVAKYTRES